MIQDNLMDIEDHILVSLQQLFGMEIEMTLTPSEPGAWDTLINELKNTVKLPVHEVPLDLHQLLEELYHILDETNAAALTLPHIERVMDKVLTVLHSIIDCEDRHAMMYYYLISCVGEMTVECPVIDQDAVVQQMLELQKSLITTVNYRRFAKLFRLHVSLNMLRDIKVNETHQEEPTDAFL